MCGWTMLHHSVFIVHISVMESSYHPPSFLLNFVTYCLYVVSKTESVTQFDMKVFDTLGLFSFSAV